MSFQPPPPPPIGFYGSASANNSRDDLTSAVSNLGLGSPSRTKKKRPARAFHTEFNSPVASGTVTPNPIQAPFAGSQAPFSPQTLQAFPHGAPQPHTPQAYPQAVLPDGQLNPPFAPGLGLSAHQPIPQDMNQSASGNQELSLSEFRHQSNHDYVTPVEGQYKSFLTFNNVMPPDATTQFHAVDQGTASSKFMRSSMYYVPESEQLRQATKLPVSVTLRPFAPLLSTEDPVPVVDMRRLEFPSDDPLDNGPIRCRRCRTYINPSMQFTQYGRFVCNICQFPNNLVPNDYSSLLDNQNQRVDKFIRPELHKGVYDLIVPKEYNFGGSETNPKPLHHVFLIDISDQSRKQNIPVLLADAIRASLYNHEQGPDSPGLKISIIAFDKRIHFFNLSPNLDSTQIVISSDLEDPFVPFSEGLFADAEESRHVIEDALNHIEALCNTNTIADSEPCFSAACRTAMMCLETVGGGKITSVLCVLPSWGPGSLKYKDNKAVGRSPAPEIEKSIFLPDNDYYKLLSKDFIDKSVGLDVHIVSPTAVDLSNIGWLSSISGGNITRWTNFDFERDGRAFTATFVNSLNKATGYQGQLKLRCSNGLQVSQYYGTSSSGTETTVGGTVPDPVIPILNEDQSFTILLEYDGKLSTKYDCHFQAALLYTDPQGVRKVRVINLVLAVSERLEDVFNFADENAIVTAIVRDTLTFLGKQPLNELRDSVNEKLVDVFTQYRAMSELGHNRNRTLTNQLLFPDSLKHLPLYILSLVKSKALRNSTGISADARLADLYQMLTMPIERLMYHLYPSLIELHSVQDSEAFFDEVHGFIDLPKSNDLTFKKMEHGVYILCDGIKVYIWVDPEANILLLKDLFGDEIETASQISALIDELPELPTQISEQARNIVKYFQSTIVGIPTVDYAGIRIVRPGIDGSVNEFKDALVEDGLQGSVISSSGSSYPEFLSNLHKAIRVQLDNDKSSNKVKKSVTAAEHSQEGFAQRLINF